MTDSVARSEVGFDEAVMTCVRKSFVFSDRASRSEYWWFFWAGFLFTRAGDLIDEYLIPNSYLGGIFGLITAALVFFPSLSASIRRLRDAGYSTGFAALPLLIVPVFYFASALENRGLGNLPTWIFYSASFGVIAAYIWLLTRPTLSSPTATAPLPLR